MDETPPRNDEGRRLEAVRRLRLLDTPAEERFDRITRLARRAFDVPIAHVSLIDDKRQWFKSIQGLALSESPRDTSLCAHTILQDAPLIVDDLTADSRFRDNPWILETPRIRFYAGYPVKAPDGSNVGTLCVMDDRPRAMTEDDRQAFHDLAAFVEKELQVVHLSETQGQLIQQVAESERARYLDDLTRLWNRQGVTDILQREIARAVRRNDTVGIVRADIDSFREINVRFGHIAGDEALRQVAQALRGGVRPYDAVGRYGGEEFLLVLPGCDREAARSVAERVRSAVGRLVLRLGEDTHSVTMSFGVTDITPTGETDLEALMQEADVALFRAKRDGRDRVVIFKNETAGKPATKSKGRDNASKD
ncbi:MAG: sensor domain-containing diguanylate cyclase [Elusimicrobia bacterium]|nr:sensor domain-containing diguanylate cyclase [Elusimicrobiota bacterium]